METYRAHITLFTPICLHVGDGCVGRISGGVVSLLGMSGVPIDTGTAGNTRMTRSIWQYGLALVVFIVGANSGLFVASSAAAATGYNTSVNRAFTMINQKRVKAGCASLRIVPWLQSPADRQSGDQAARNRMGHDGADGSTTGERLGGLGYSRWAENIAQFQSAKAAVNFWAASPAHRASMLNCAFHDTGLAVASSDSGRLYWTQTFGA
jgi:uncharacterized protein YkwD